jgi:hypothetical protein
LILYHDTVHFLPLTYKAIDSLFLPYLGVAILIFYEENTVELSLWSEELLNLIKNQYSRQKVKTPIFSITYKSSSGQVELAGQCRALGFLVFCYRGHH